MEQIRANKRQTSRGMGTLDFYCILGTPQTLVARLEYFEHYRAYNPPASSHSHCSVEFHLVLTFCSHPPPSLFSVFVLLSQDSTC